MPHPSTSLSLHGELRLAFAAASAIFSRLARFKTDYWFSGRYGHEFLLPAAVEFVAGAEEAPVSRVAVDAVLVELLTVTGRPAEADDDDDVLCDDLTCATAIVLQTEDAARAELYRSGFFDCYIRARDAIPASMGMDSIAFGAVVQALLLDKEDEDPLGETFSDWAEVYSRLDRNPAFRVSAAAVRVEELGPALAACLKPITKGLHTQLRDEFAGLARHRRLRRTSAEGQPDPASNEAKALALLAIHPDWTNKQLAAAIPCHVKSLSRYSRLRAARRAMRQERSGFPSGYRDAEGGVEAIG